MNAMLNAMDTSEVLDKEIAGRRLLKAPRELVFKVWSDPAHLAQWWGPDGFTTTTHHFDFKAGGEWRFTMHGPDGRDYENTINYDEVTPPERLRYRHAGEPGGEPISFHVEVDFAAQGGNTLLSLRTIFPSNHQRDYVIKNYGAFEGMKQHLARLASYLAAQQ